MIVTDDVEKVHGSPVDYGGDHDDSDYKDIRNGFETVDGVPVCYGGDADDAGCGDRQRPNRANRACWKWHPSRNGRKQYSGRVRQGQRPNRANRACFGTVSQQERPKTVFRQGQTGTASQQGLLGTVSQQERPKTVLNRVRRGQGPNLVSQGQRPNRVGRKRYPGQKQYSQHCQSGTASHLGRPGTVSQHRSKRQHQQ